MKLRLTPSSNPCDRSIESSGPRSRTLLGFLLPLLLATVGCSYLRKAEVPMYAQASPPTSDASCAVVLLPGKGGSYKDFLKAGFEKAVQERGLDIQVISADAHLGYYRDNTIVERLREDVVAPLLEEGKRVWLVGVSMGGLGTLIYTREHPEDASGLVAIAPFLGKGDLVEKIVAAGGPLHWQPTPPPADNTVEGLWAWVGRSYADGPPVPTYLAYGTEDRVRPGNELFAPLIPAENTLTLPGGHNFSVWRKLWDEMLDRGVICRESDAR